MSGVGEAIAIVSCVAGLIQAYDAGSRIFKQIKARRQAHGALPPLDLLEESLEKGKTQIQDIVADGNERFGSSFENCDSRTQSLLCPRVLMLTWNSDYANSALSNHDCNAECPPRRPDPG